MLSKSSKSKATTKDSSTKLPMINTKLRLLSQNSSIKINRKLFQQNKTQVLRIKSSKVNYFRAHTQISRAKGEKKDVARQRQHTKYGQHIIEEQIQYISKLFNQINRLRQQHGVISLNEDLEKLSQYQSEDHEVPYNPQLHEMNESISIIKTEIEKHMQRILKELKHLPILKHYFEELIEEECKLFLKVNERCGKMNAMKAQHRLIMNNKQLLQKIKSSENQSL